MFEKTVENAIALAADVLFWASAVAAVLLFWYWDKMRFAILPMAGFFGGGLVGFSIMWFSGPERWRKHMTFSAILQTALSIALFYFYVCLFFWE
jgi:hypothetical protein